MLYCRFYSLKTSKIISGLYLLSLCQSNINFQAPFLSLHCRHFPGEDDSNYVGPHDPGVDDPVWKDRLDGQRAIFVELGPEYGTRYNRCDNSL